MHRVRQATVPTGEPLPVRMAAPASLIGVANDAPERSMPVLCLPLTASEVAEEVSSRKVVSDTVPAVAANPVVNCAPATLPRAPPTPPVALGLLAATATHNAPPPPNPPGRYVPAAS